MKSNDFGGRGFFFLCGFFRWDRGMGRIRGMMKGKVKPSPFVAT
jgi:hypothetical protein